MNMQTVMYSVNIPGILGTLAIIAIVLIVLGFREKSDLSRRVKLLRAGIALIGLTILLTGFLWYASLALVYITLSMRIEDIVLLTLFSTIGGIAIGIALTMKRV